MVTWEAHCVAQRDEGKHTGAQGPRSATAILDEMKEQKVESAVLGYHHQRTLGEIILGTTAQHLAKSAPCHLLLHIPPRD